MNTHPVRIGLIMKNTPIMLENIGQVCHTLEEMSERQFKDRRDVNEILSLKFHIIYYIVKDIEKQVKRAKL